jgi:3',5'-cyclic-AMP phosphodiesterase
MTSASSPYQRTKAPVAADFPFHRSPIRLGLDTLAGVTRFVVAHLSDCHIGATDEAPARLRRALDHIAACAPQPDVLLLSGDMADHGLDVEYEVAAELLSTVTMPLVTCPGNHDVRTRFVHHLGPAESVIDVADYRLIALNSLVDAAEGERIDHGGLTEDSLQLLHEALTAERPTFVALHHPPVDLHVDLMDPIKLTTAQRLAEVLTQHDNVVAVLVGHAHTMASTTFAGVPVLVGGGLVSTVTTDAEDMPRIDYTQPPTIALHLIEDDHLVTHWRVV